VYSYGQESGKYTHLTKGTDKRTNMAKEVTVYSSSQESGKELLSVLNLTESPQSTHTHTHTHTHTNPSKFQATTLQYSFHCIAHNHQTADSTQPHTFKRCRQATYKPEHGNHRRFGATRHPHCSESMSIRNVHSAL